VFPTRNNHHDRSEATLAFLSCLNCPRSVNWNLVSVSLLSFLADVNPSPARWKCGNPALLFLAGFPSPVERVENSVFFEFSTLSTGRHFHGALHLVVLGAQRRRQCVHRRLGSFFLLGSFFRSWPKSEVSSQKSCARIAQERRSHGPLIGGTFLCAQASLPPRFLRIDSPRISMR
jgi:hypothetical protein